METPIFTVTAKAVVAMNLFRTDAMDKFEGLKDAA